MIQRKKLTLAISQAIGLGLFAIQGTQAATFVVDNASDVDNGNFGPGNLTLREAIIQANASPDADTIFFAGNAFAIPQTITLTNSELLITGPVTIIGPGADSLTLDGLGNSRLFSTTNGDDGDVIDVTISGMRLQNGNGMGATANDRGGCIHSFENLTLNDSIVTGCSAFDGGGIWSRFGTLTVQNSTLYNNSGNNKGGGIYTRDTPGIIRNSTISGNNIRRGGGIYFRNGGVLTLSTVTGNSSDIAGSGIYSTSVITLNHAIVEGNAGVNDLESNGSTVNLYNSVIGTTGPQVQLNGSNNSIGTSAELGPLQDNGGATPTHSIALSSPAVNRGDVNCASIDTDQRGQPRNDDACDSGAIELQGVADILVETASFSTAADGLCSLPEALSNANGNNQGAADCAPGSGLDIIGFDPTLTGNSVAFTFQQSISDDLVINGDSDGDGVADITLDGDGATRLFNNAAGDTLTLMKITLTGGSANNGGGIYNYASSLTISDTIITGNTASGSGGGIWSDGSGGIISISNSSLVANTATENGGGIYNNNDVSLIISDSTLRGNTADQGGGLYNRSFTGLRMDRSTFTENTATNGGGIYSTNGTLTITDSTISGNTANSSGGGIYLTSNGELSFYRSSLTGNTATNGGALSSSRSVFLDNATISGNVGTNTASPVGGLLVGNTVTMSNSTLYGTQGVGIYVTGGNQAFINNSIIAGNSAGDCNLVNLGGGSQLNGNLDSDGSCDVFANDHLTAEEPLLAPLADNEGPTFTHALLEGSPAINSGRGDLCLQLDQRGQLRDGLCDRGAFEAPGGPNIGVNTTDFNFTTDGLCSLPEAIENANQDSSNFPDCATGNGPDVIGFAPSLNGSTVLVNSTVFINSEVTLDGPGADQLTLSGDNNQRIITAEYNSILTINGLTLNDGYSSFGGAINNSGTLTINDSTLTGNTATDAGGAISNAFNTLTTNNVIFENNVANGRGGGAIYHGASATMMTINQSQLRSNLSNDRGGAVLASGDNTTITQSTLTGNSANSTGGAVQLRFRDLSINNSTVYGNEATYGGGIAADGNSAVLTITNTTISGNTVSIDGGSLFSPDASIDLFNSVFANTTPGGPRGASECFAPNIQGNLNNLMEDGSCATNAVDQVVADPMLLDLTDNGGLTPTLLPMAGSPVIDAGHAGSCTTIDQRGTSRPQDGDDDGMADCDIGSVEIRGNNIFEDGFED